MNFPLPYISIGGGEKYDTVKVESSTRKMLPVEVGHLHGTTELDNVRVVGLFEHRKLIRRPT